MDNQAPESWQILLKGWGVSAFEADRKFREISEYYGGPGRYYHNLNHVLDVLKTVESLSSHAKHLHAVKLAAWLHDVIYDSRASDNEERSAEYAVRLCEELSILDGSLVASLILKTKTHDAGADTDGQVLLDSDLAILGAAAADYRDYADNIRREFAWVPEAEYRKGRWQVLEKFLERPTIYHLLRHLEVPARRNLVAEIAQLAC
jgi:predicted metal-dependent HD superfamily phosphohydrolase